MTSWTCLSECNEELSSLCITNISGTPFNNLGTKRVCMSECSESNCINWNGEFSQFKSLWKNSGNLAASDTLTTIPKNYLKDWCSLSGLPTNDEDNCMLSCMSKPTCVGYQWDGNNCTLFKSMVAGGGIPSGTIKWVCDLDGTPGNSCDYEDLLQGKTQYVSGSNGGFAFQPSMSCGVYNCDNGVLQPYQPGAPVVTKSPTSAPTFSPIATFPPTMAPVISTLAPTMSPTAAPTVTPVVGPVMVWNTPEPNCIPRSLYNGSISVNILAPFPDSVKDFIVGQGFLASGGDQYLQFGLIGLNALTEQQELSVANECGNYMVAQGHDNYAITIEFVSPPGIYLWKLYTDVPANSNWEPYSPSAQDQAPIKVYVSSLIKPQLSGLPADPNNVQCVTQPPAVPTASPTRAPLASVEVLPTLVWQGYQCVPQAYEVSGWPDDIIASRDRFAELATQLGVNPNLTPDGRYMTTNEVFFNDSIKNTIIEEMSKEIEIRQTIIYYGISITEVSDGAEWLFLRSFRGTSPSGWTSSKPDYQMGRYELYMSRWSLEQDLPNYNIVMPNTPTEYCPTPAPTRAPTMSPTAAPTISPPPTMAPTPTPEPFEMVWNSTVCAPEGIWSGEYGSAIVDPLSQNLINVIDAQGARTAATDSNTPNGFVVMDSIGVTDLTKRNIILSTMADEIGQMGFTNYGFEIYINATDQAVIGRRRDFTSNTNWNIRNLTNNKLFIVYLSPSAKAVQTSLPTQLDPCPAPPPPLVPNIDMIWSYFPSGAYNTVSDKELKVSDNCNIDGSNVTADYGWDDWNDKFNPMTVRDNSYLDMAMFFTTIGMQIPENGGLLNTNTNIECGNYTDINEVQSKCIGMPYCAGYQINESDNSYCLKYNAIGDSMTTQLQHVGDTYQMVSPGKNVSIIPSDETCEDLDIEQIDGTYKINDCEYECNRQRILGENCYGFQFTPSSTSGWYENWDGTCSLVRSPFKTTSSTAGYTDNNTEDYGTVCNNGLSRQYTKVTATSKDNCQSQCNNLDLPCFGYSWNNDNNECLLWNEGNIQVATHRPGNFHCVTKDNVSNNYVIQYNSDTVALKTPFLKYNNETITGTELACSPKNRTNIVDAQIECNQISNCIGLTEDDTNICMYTDDDYQKVSSNGTTAYMKTDTPRYTVYDGYTLPEALRPRFQSSSEDLDLFDSHVHSCKPKVINGKIIDFAVYTTKDIQECKDKVAQYQSECMNSPDANTEKCYIPSNLIWYEDQCVDNCRLTFLTDRDDNANNKCFSLNINPSFKYCREYDTEADVRADCDSSDSCIGYTSRLQQFDTYHRYWGCLRKMETNTFEQNHSVNSNSNIKYFNKFPYIINENTNQTGENIMCIDSKLGRDSFAIQDHIDMCNMMEDCAGIQYISNRKVTADTDLLMLGEQVCLKKSGTKVPNYTMDDEPRSLFKLFNNDNASWDYKWFFLEKNLNVPANKEEAQQLCNNNSECLGFTENKTDGYPYCTNLSGSSDTNLYDSTTQNYNEKTQVPIVYAEYNGYSPVNTTECGIYDSFTELQDACTKDIDCLGYTTTSGSNWDPLCKVKTTGTFIKDDSIKYYKKMPVGITYTESQNTNREALYGCNKLSGGTYGPGDLELLQNRCEANPHCDGYTTLNGEPNCAKIFAYNDMFSAPGYNYYTINRDTNPYSSTDYLTYTGANNGNSNSGNPIQLSYLFVNKIQGLFIGQDAELAALYNQVGTNLVDVTNSGTAGRFPMTTKEEWVDAIPLLDISVQYVPVLEIKIIDNQYSIVQNAFMMPRNVILFNLGSQTPVPGNEKVIYISTNTYLSQMQ